MTKSDKKKIEEGRNVYQRFAKPLLILAILATAQEAHASGEKRSHTRIHTVLDNSGSMRRSYRFRHGVQALERWVEALDSQAGITIELLVAADHVVHRGTFELRDESSRCKMLDRLRELEAERSSRTVFKKIDEELATFIRKHTHPDEQFGVLFVTDGRSDQPESDLRLQELGDQVLPLGGGLYAAVSGPIPAQEDLVGGQHGRTPTSQREATWSRSKYRRLLTPSVTIVEPSPLSALLPERLSGGFSPVRILLDVKNSSDISREVWLQTHAPDGVIGHFVPETLVLPGGASTEVALELAVRRPISGPILLTGQGPDGSVSKATLNVEITTKPWLTSNLFPCGGCLAFVALILGVFLTIRRRAWFILPVGRPEHGFYMRPGEEVPLSTADPGFPSGTWIARRRGCLWLRTDGEPMRVAGINLLPGHKVRYRLRTPIDASAATIVLDRRSRREAAGRLVFIAGASERATACDELL